MSAGARRLTEGDIPPLPVKLAQPPVRAQFGSDAAFEAAHAKHQADAAWRVEQMAKRRKLKEQLREQQREKRDRSGRARPSDDAAQATKRRQEKPEVVQRHREREAARAESGQPEPTEDDIAAASYAINHQGKTPGYGRVSRRAVAIACERKVGAICLYHSPARPSPASAFTHR